MKYFTNCSTLDELKKQYRRLCLINHPDHGGDTATMAAINNINALVKIPGLIVELCGCWLWISGDTKPNKEALKAAGCRWSSSKKMWYWRHQEDGAHWSHGKKSMSQLRMKYGSQTFAGTNGSEAYALEA